METWSIVLVVLAAVLTGALLPLLFQARSTLRSAQLLLDASAPVVKQTLDEILKTTREVREVTGTLAQSRPQAEAFMTAVAGLTTTLNQLQASVRTASAVGAAVGPALAAAFHAFRASRAEDAAVLAAAKPGSRVTGSAHNGVDNHTPTEFSNE